MKKLFLALGLVLAGRMVLAQDYPQQLSISRSIAAGTVSDQKAVGTIMASNVVSGAATAHYTAGQSITLLPGFVAQAGSVFRATVAPVSSVRGGSDAPGLLVRAYPNPFTTQTTIDYNLPTDGRVRHTLLDVKGQVLRQVDEAAGESAGQHQTQLEGAGLPVGTYLYRIQVGDESRTLRLLKRE